MRAYAAILFASVLAAGCGGNASWGSFGASGGGSTGNGMASDGTPASGSPSKLFNLRSPAAAPVAYRAHRVDGGSSWTLARAKSAAALLYAGDWSNSQIDVFDFFNGKQVGTLTDSGEPYGMCVDAKGNVYVANFGGGAVEYARGGTKPLKTYDTAGEPIGCAVDKRGDLAVTSFSPGAIVVYARGNPKQSETYRDSDCQYAWAAGYDDQGNLYSVGESSKISVCELPAGSKTMRSVTLSGGQIDFPGGTTWDGKHLLLSDQEAGGDYQTGLISVSEDATTGDLTAIREITLSDDCYSDYVDLVNPFILGKKNPPVDEHQGQFVVGPNLWCADSGQGGVAIWRYLKGVQKVRHIGTSTGAYYSAAVSLKD